jgi:hypothetical protein
MRFPNIVLSLLLAGSLVMAAESPTPPKFTAKPTATKAGDKVKIEFAVDRETDVAVFIEDGAGKVVRHLVAGVLGANAPAPLKPGLAQSLEWDGKADYGRAALPSVASGGGGFKVRVALGLNVRYDKVLLRDANALTLIRGLAVGPDGILYVLAPTGGTIFWGETVLAFNRDGTYHRTVVPFPSDLRADQVKDFEAFDLRGRPVPRVQNERLGLYPFGGGARRDGMAVTPDGKAVMWTCADGTRVAAVGTGGAAAWKNPAGSPLPNTKGAVFLATSADGKWAYLTGAGGVPVVWRVPLPDRAPASAFFGDASKKGKDQTSLGGPPRGLAVDGKGNLLIADRDNDRVLVVNEADGKYVGEFAATKPDWLAVDPGSGVVYVTSLSGKNGAMDLIKFSPSTGSGPGGGWKDAKAVATLPVTLGGDGSYVMAADCTAKPAIVWIGKDYSGLYRVEDLGAKFGEPRNVSTDATGGNGGFLDVTVDRFRPDKEVYTRIRRGTSAGTCWLRFNEESGKVDKIDLGGFTGGGAPSLTPGPDGNLYGLWWPCYFSKWDRNGKPAAWAKPDHRELKGDGCPGKNWPANASYIGAGMGDLRPMIAMRPDGRMLVLENALWGRDAKSLLEYLPSGERAPGDPVIWDTSCAVSPRLDPAGNIYIAEIVKPASWPYPSEMQSLPGKEAKAAAANMYGSILKFSPKGGTVHWGSSKKKGQVPFEGEPKLDPSLKTQDAASSWGEQMTPVKVTGAEWIHPGFSKIGRFACTCENMTFDVDEFGRVWFPDLNLFQVRVIDTNGNALTKFGSYGNAESCGPDSPVIDAATKKLRPRRADDLKDLKSSFAEPEIAFAWLVGVAATDRYVYTGDSINRRMLRLKQVYAAEESCEVKSP